MHGKHYNRGILRTDADLVKKRRNGMEILVICAYGEYLEKYGGHIGYSVRPDERRKGDAAWMLMQMLEKCRERGMKRVLVTCLAENGASRRTILANGGRYESTVHESEEDVDLERYWIEV